MTLSQDAAGETQDSLESDLSQNESSVQEDAKTEAMGDDEGPLAKLMTQVD